MESKEKYVVDDDRQPGSFSHNEQEKQYLDRLRKLLDLKRRGDWIMVAEILNISPKNAEISFARLSSKYHTQVVEALTTVIETRNKLLKRL